MSRISAREKKLVWLIFALLFIFGNVIALRWRSREMDSLKKQRHQLELALIEDEALYEERSAWENRQAWLDSAIQPFPGREAADAQLLESVKNSAQAAGVKIDSSELLEPTKDGGGYFARAGVSVRTSGDLNQLAKWIHGFQEPGNFRSLTKFEFKNDDKKPGWVHCSFQCWEWRRRAPSEVIKEVVLSEK